MAYTIKDYENIKNKLNKLKHQRELIEKDLIKQGLLDEEKFKAIKYLKRKAKLSLMDKRYANTFVKEMDARENNIKKSNDKSNDRESNLVKNQVREANKNINLLNNCRIKDEKKIREITNVIEQNSEILKDKLED